MNVPYMLWKLLEPDVQQRIRDIRTEQRSGTGGAVGEQKKTVSFQPEPEKEDGGIPRQYSNPANRMTNKTEKEDQAKNVTTEEKNEDKGNATPTEDPHEPTEFEDFNRFMNSVQGMSVEEFYEHFDERNGHMVTTTMGEESENPIEDELAISMHDGSMNVRAHTDFYEVIARLCKGENTTISTTDNGADTCVVGNGWAVFIKTDRKANLVGFDSHYARKKGLPIVTADTVVKTQDGTEIILRAHETVYNEGSPTTLISEFQVRSHGLVIDSVHKEHAASIDG